MAKIRIVIEKGKVTYDVTETAGEGCRELTRPFQESMGLPAEETLKPEFYEQQLLENEE